MAIRRNTQGKIIPYYFTLEEIQDADRVYEGFCIACGARRGYCEPDAVKYECEECGMKTVYGAQEIVIRGWVK